MVIQCPHCETTYSAARCGVDIPQHKHAVVTIACALCKNGFDLVVTWIPAVEGTPAVIPPWWSRAWRSPVAAVPPVPGYHTVESRSR